MQKRHWEKDILKAIANSDEDAFASFYYSHFDRLATKVYHILKNKHQTQEVLQDVFMTIWRKRAEIQSIADIEGYLFVLARNASLNQLQKNIRQTKAELDFHQLHLSADSSCFADTADQLSTWMDRAIEQLPSQQKRVYVLSQLERKKYVEVAAEMQVSRETVKKYLQLARQSIKIYLMRHRDSIVSIILFFFYF